MCELHLSRATLSLPATLLCLAAATLAHAECNWNVDANPLTTSQTDGLVILRRLQNLSGAAITTAAIGRNATRDAAAIAQHIDSNRANWDLDGDGFVDAAADGVIIARHMLGFRGAALTTGINARGTPSRSAGQIETFIAEGCPATVVAVAPCTAPITLTNTAATAPRVGTGSAASCTSAALQTAVSAGGVVTFNCGAAPVTIAISSTIIVPPLVNTVVDGGGKVTLDGGGVTRIMQLKNGNYRSNTNGLTLQRITLANGRASGTRFFPPSPSNPACSFGYADGSGGAIDVLDARLHVIDVSFVNNAAATPGPDVGGGAIYAAGALDLTIVDSRFTGNSGSNSGAVGLLQSNGRFFNTLFQNNEAKGEGQNYAGGAATGCRGIGDDQGGAGGNGGAVAIDGSDDTDQIFCGTRFINNKAGALAGAIFRTANFGSRLTTIDRSEISGNTAKQGGALFISNSVPLNIVRSTISNNSAESFGAAHIERSRLNIENTTFAGNVATNSLAAALYQNESASNSVIRNATFANNRITGGSGLFSAAIAGGINFPVFNTVFANNITNDPFNPMQCWFVPASGSNNMQRPKARSSGNADDNLCVQDIAFADPALGALVNNGGSTSTLLPAVNSPLIGAGRNCPGTDQIGNVRVAASCTIGAVER